MQSLTQSTGIRFLSGYFDFSGELAKATYANYPVFNLPIPTKCSGVPDEVLNPANTWKSKTDYDATVKKLANLFLDNFKSYAAKAEESVKAAGPKL